MIEKKENKLITQELKDKLIEKKSSLVGARSSKLSDVVVKEILKQIQQKYELEQPGEAIPILALLFQGGGTARSCDGNMVVTIYDKNIKLAEIRKILKEAKCNRAERKLARSLADEIYEISALLEIDGNLSKKIQRLKLDKKFNSEERAWLSDFQADNENCPIELRNLIVETFKKKGRDTKFGNK